MTAQTKLVLQSRLSLLRKVVEQQAQTIKHYENKCVDAMMEKQRTLETIEEIEAQLEAAEADYELVEK